jgi:hypothetical protein
MAKKINFNITRKENFLKKFLMVIGLSFILISPIFSQMYFGTGFQGLNNFRLVSDTRNIDYPSLTRRHSNCIGYGQVVKSWENCCSGLEKSANIWKGWSTYCYKPGEGLVRFFSPVSNFW